MGLMHKSLLIDSDVLIDHLRKDTTALAFLSGEIERGSLLFMSVVSRTEIIAGMRKGEEEIVGSLFDNIGPVDVDVENTIPRNRERCRSRTCRKCSRRLPRCLHSGGRIEIDGLYLLLCQGMIINADIIDLPPEVIRPRRMFSDHDIPGNRPQKPAGQ